MLLPYLQQIAAAQQLASMPQPQGPVSSPADAAPYLGPTPSGQLPPATPAAADDPFGLYLPTKLAQPVLTPGQAVPTMRTPEPAPPPTAQPSVAAGPTAGDTWRLPEQPGSANDFQLQAIPGGGGAMTLPAKETELRGPQLLEAQQRRNEAVGQAIGDIQQRSVEQAALDGAMAQDQARRAYAREDAANASAAERADDLEARQKDFDGTVKQLSQMSLNPDRFWASRSTPQTISGLVAITLGGFLQGVRGGSNPGLDMINQYIDRDLHAQEFDYAQKHHVAEAKQSAFGMAMQKYQNVDAARAAARAAALDSVQAEMQQQAAASRSTNAQNIASLAAADLANDRTNQIAQGVAFTPARQVAAPQRYLDRDTGMILSEKEAHEAGAKWKEQHFEYGKLGLGEYMKELAAHREEGDKGATHIADSLREAGVPEALSRAEAARKALSGAPLTLTERATPLAGAKSDNPMAHKLVFGAEASEREAAWSNFKAAAIKALVGTRGESQPQLVERMAKIFDSAGDQESRMSAIKQFEGMMSDETKNIKAGASPEAQRTYEQRRATANGGTPQGGDADPLAKPVRP